MSNSSDAAYECPSGIEPCSCRNFFSKLTLVCEDFENINQVHSALRIISSPIEDLNIINDNPVQLPNDISQEVCIANLFLSYPQLHLPDLIFTNQRRCLKQLEIGKGITEDLPINALVPLKNLRILMLELNHITVLKDPLWKLHLDILILDDNNIFRIYSNVFPPTLKTLLMTYNWIESLNSSLLLLNNLAVLDVTGNRIKTLNGELTGLVNLEELYVVQNRIETLDDSLHNLTKLKILNLSRNRIISLGNSFNDLVSLEKLHLSYNSLTELFGNEFQSLGNLTGLYLSHNRLKSLGNSLIHLKKLKSLNVADNQLVEIGEKIKCIDQLRALGMPLELLINLQFFDVERQNSPSDDVIN